MIIEFSGLSEKLYHPLHSSEVAHTPPSTEEGVKKHKSWRIEKIMWNDVF